VPVPVQFDAAFWASRLAAVGVAPRPVPFRRLTSAALAAALEEVTGEPLYARRARTLSERIRSEDGVTPILSALDRLDRT
jgi:UDP:flavonoid glycosyltransferase YjiC (YdhE family)